MGGRPGPAPLRSMVPSPVRVGTRRRGGSKRCRSQAPRSRAPRTAADRPDRTGSTQPKTWARAIDPARARALGLARPLPVLGVLRPSSQAPALVHSITGAGGLSTRTVVQAARRYDEYPEA